MQLFEPNNILPQDGNAIYYGIIINDIETHYYMDKLLTTIAWHNDTVTVFGKQYVLNRKTAWYGNANYVYTYAKHTQYALPWTKELLTLKKLVEQISGCEYNSCLLNLYHSGNEGMSWHSDDEKELGLCMPIASLSLGATRKFVFKHKKTKQILPILLENGSLLVMKDHTQTHWLHSLPKTTRINTPRINLTFRTIVV